MKPKGYLVFHLNLAFSSIEEEAWADVIKRCYHPLLDLIEKTGIPIGIELTGWTLKQIERIDIAWIERFKALINAGDCELIGSGYCQIIGPLVPYKVNDWNQKLGIESYINILDCRPEIILVNEMAFSSSLVDLYNRFGYKGFIMDRNNIKLALHSSNSTSNKIPTHARGVKDTILPVLWSDSILFQKVQQFAHGDIAINDYLVHLENRINCGELMLPIYCNDAEVFDYRPGRFSEERPTHPEGEWKRLEKLLKSITTNTEIEFISPTQALKISDEVKDKFVSRLVTAAYPIPVKKQAKYNVARWAVAGRNNLWLNTMCYRIEKLLTKNKNNSIDDWRALCELWASDLRTHITDKRWVKTKSKLRTVSNEHGISENFTKNQDLDVQYHSLDDVIGQCEGANISTDEEGVLLHIATKNINLELNLRRGLTIKSLAFASHKMKPCIGTLPHGHFQCISLGADYYSGGTVIELPLFRSRVTDLERVEPLFLKKDNGDIEVRARIKTQFGNIDKVVVVSDNSESILLGYDFTGWDKFIGSVRLGTVTLLNQFNNKDTEISCFNGGGIAESFNLSEKFDHTEPASTIVSSSRGLGATSGEIYIKNNEKGVILKWNPGECSTMPMLKYVPSSSDDALLRIFFSTQEFDDTSKQAKDIAPFDILISPLK